MKLPKDLKSLADRPLDKSVWEGNIVRDYYIASDGKVLIDVTCVVGPKIREAEKLFRRKHRRDYTPALVDDLLERTLKATPVPASEMGWAAVKGHDLKGY